MGNDTTRHGLYASRTGSEGACISMAKRKKPEIYRARSTAAGWFSKYIRLRDCISSEGVGTEGRCITCGKLLPFNKLQCGHFMPGRTDPLVFDERNAAAQCYQCNVRLQGKWPEFEVATEGRWGAGTVEILKELYFNPVKFTTEDYRRLADYYRKMFKEISKNG